ncbi:MAG: sulfur carrier protein [Pyrinomonadaceae bacterium]|nr:sulfur carrier protein [Pyrinomonadaceae bacterium]
MRVQINGEIRELPEELTLDALVRQLALAPERLAIELNREVVRRTRWAETLMRDGDQVEIVHFVGGGSGEAHAAELRSVSQS